MNKKRIIIPLVLFISVLLIAIISFIAFRATLVSDRARLKISSKIGERLNARGEITELSWSSSGNIISDEGYFSGQNTSWFRKTEIQDLSIHASWLSFLSKKPKVHEIQLNKIDASIASPQVRSDKTDILKSKADRKSTVAKINIHHFNADLNFNALPKLTIENLALELKPEKSLLRIDGEGGLLIIAGHSDLRIEEVYAQKYPAYIQLDNLVLNDGLNGTLKAKGVFATAENSPYPTKLTVKIDELESAQFLADKLFVPLNGVLSGVVSIEGLEGSGKVVTTGNIAAVIKEKVNIPLINNVLKMLGINQPLKLEDTIIDFSYAEESLLVKNLESHFPGVCNIKSSFSVKEGFVDGDLALTLDEQWISMLPQNFFAELIPVDFNTRFMGIDKHTLYLKLSGPVSNPISDITEKISNLFPAAVAETSVEAGKSLQKHGREFFDDSKDFMEKGIKTGEKVAEDLLDITKPLNPFLN